MLELCVSCVACVSSGRRAPVRLLREALPPAGPSVPAVRTIPSACQAGSAWSPPHHLQMAWQCHCHTCNLRCSQDCPLSPSPDSANSAMVFQTPFYGRKPPFFITSWLLCLCTALWLPGPGTACYFTQHYVRKWSLLLF